MSMPVRVSVSVCMPMYAFMLVRMLVRMIVIVIVILRTVILSFHRLILLYLCQPLILKPGRGGRCATAQYREIRVKRL